jgi:glutaredoxin-dependent peroxiredoxin
MSVTVNQQAPNFTLYNSEKNKVTLSEQKGSKVLLLFFPAAFTSVCTAELCSVRDNIAAYNNANAKVFGISVDTVFTLGKFKEEQKLNFPLLSDFNKEVAKLYGALYETFVLDMKGVAKRSAFVIDENGVIKYAEVLEDAGQVPDFTGIQNALKE